MRMRMPTMPQHGHEGHVRDEVSTFTKQAISSSVKLGAGSC
jgi:hypothetical protein